MSRLYRNLLHGGHDGDRDNGTAETYNNQYIHKQGNKWVVVDKQGKVLSHHDSREKAEESFRAMEMHKHG